MPEHTQDLIALTAEIVSAHVANNSVHPSEVPALIGGVFEALSQLGAPAASPAEQAKPQAATTVRKSLSSSDHIISMIDGKPYKMLRRHLNTHGYTPETYREAFGLPSDYPMVARDYAEHRRAIAHKIGLGRNPDPASAAAAAAKASPPQQETGEGCEMTEKRPRRKLSAAFGDAVAAAKEHLGGE